MKERTKRTLSILLIMLLAFSMILTGCGKKNDAAEDQETAEEAKENEEAAAASENQGGTDADAEATDEEGEESEEEEEAEEPKDEAGRIKAAYADVLKKLLKTGNLPGGLDLNSLIVEDSLPITESEYAIYDVNGDGKDELVIDFLSTYSNSMFERIYAFDDERGKPEEIFFSRPLTDFYTNGFIRSDVMYNDSVAGQFWPYELFEYDPNTRRYERNAFIDAWDGNMFPTDSEGNAFPADLDKDGDKMLYYIYLDSDEENSPYIVEKAELEDWFNRETYSAKLLDVRWNKLTEENIKNYAKNNTN